jgi:hypothetical protein
MRPRAAPIPAGCCGSLAFTGWEIPPEDAGGTNAYQIPAYPLFAVAAETAWVQDSPWESVTDMVTASPKVADVATIATSIVPGGGANDAVVTVVAAVVLTDAGELASVEIVPLGRISSRAQPPPKLATDP